MANIKNTQFVTDLEREVLENIIHSEYMDVNNDEMIDWAIWSFSATNESKHLAGALGSLVKKGLCFSCKDKRGVLLGEKKRTLSIKNIINL